MYRINKGLEAQYYTDHEFYANYEPQADDHIYKTKPGSMIPGVNGPEDTYLGTAHDLFTGWVVVTDDRAQGRNREDWNDEHTKDQDLG